MVQENIDNLHQLINRLAGSNLLVIDKEISFFLSGIADNIVFREIITDCNKNYFFEEDWQKFLFQKKITLPHNKRDRIAFVIGLLYKLDIKELSSIDLLKTFYSDNSDMQKAYATFYCEIILPFRDAFIAMLKGEPVSSEEVEERLPVLDKMNEDITEWLNALAERVSQYAHNYDEKSEAEMLFMIKGFSDNLDSGDNVLKKLLWTGLKNTLYKFDIGYKEISEIDKLLALYGLNMEI